MPTTRYIASWSQLTGTRSPEADVMTFLSTGNLPVTDAQVSEIAHQWRAAINAKMPEGVYLHGSDFYGVLGATTAGLREIIDSVELFPVIQRIL